MKILHVETGHHLYGGGLQVLHLLDGLQGEPRCHNELACPPDSPLSDAAADKVEAIHPVAFQGDADPRFLLHLIGLLRKRQPDILHIHSRRGADLWGPIAGHLRGVPVVLSRRVDNPEPRWLARLRYGLCREVITISKGIREILISEGVPADRITVVPSGMDFSRYQGSCDSSWFTETFPGTSPGPVIGMVAQFIERKGHRDLLAALPKILEAFPNTRVLLFGRGPLQEDLERECRELGLADAVQFAGFREDLERILPCLDLVVHPAHMEGLGVALLQAAAAGRPIVAAPVGGIPEIVRSGETGMTAPPGDSRALAGAMLTLLRDPDRAWSLGEAAREHVRQHFSLESMVAGNLAVYRRILGEVEGKKSA